MTVGNQLLIKRLRKEMNKAGINARELSDRANVGRSFVYDILSGKSANPTMSKIISVARVLGVSVPYLVANSNDNNEVLKGIDDNFYSVPILFVNQRDDDFELSTKPIIQSNLFRLDWIKSELDIPAEKLREISITGDQMSPTLNQGDNLLIDVSSKEPSSEGVFILFDGKNLVAQRLKVVSQEGSKVVEVISDNKQYDSYTTSLASLEVVGKVLWVSRTINF